MEMWIVLLWLFFCVLVGLFANQRRNRSGVAWFLVSFVFSPLVGFLLVAVLREADGERTKGPAWLLGTSENRPWSRSTSLQTVASDASHASFSHWDRLKAKRDW
jgi:hypothetical protein